MKKLIIILMLLFLPLALFAQQKYRSVASVDASTITGTIDNYPNFTKSGYLWIGSEHVFYDDVARATGLDNAGAIGYKNRLFSWSSFAAGTGNYCDGKITGAIGNTNIGSANDSFVGGNRSVAGRRMYPVASQGVDSLDGVGQRAWVTLSADEGDCTSFFPYDGIDNVTTRYGSGATEVDGNIYASGYSAPGDLTWAMHPYCIIRDQAGETNIIQMKILKSEYTGGVTKIWYDSTASAYATISQIYSSYSPVVYVNGIQAGNSHISGGRYASTWGYASVGLGQTVRSWGGYSFAVNGETSALRPYTFASGRYAVAERDYQQSYATSKFSKNGDAQEGKIIKLKTTSGAGWHDFVILEHLKGNRVYSGKTKITGIQTNATSGRINESCSYEIDWAVVKGDTSLVSPDSINATTETFTKHGNVFADGDEVMFTDFNASDPAGLYEGQPFYIISRTDSTFQVSDTPGGSAFNISTFTSTTLTMFRINYIGNTRTLIGRNFSDGGDGLTTGVRAQVYEAYFIDSNLRIRIDATANRTIRWMAETVWNEMASN